MRALLLVTGLLSLVMAGFVATSIRSDIQLQIVATCFLGAMLLFGQSAILSGQADIRQKLKDRP
ncbi:hypothetical protein [Methylobacterium fujisawaense]